jgi:hypothetical protein
VRLAWLLRCGKAAAAVDSIQTRGVLLGVAVRVGVAVGVDVLV